MECVCCLSNESRHDCLSMPHWWLVLCRVIVECVSYLLNVLIARGMCLVLAEWIEAGFLKHSSLVACALSNTCGMCILLVECVHCLRTVSKHGLLNTPRWWLVLCRLLVDCVDCMWNVYIAYEVCTLVVECAQA